MKQGISTGEVYGDMSPDLADAVEFEKFKNGLRFLDPDQVRAGLEDLLELGAQELLDAMQAQDDVRYSNAILDYITRINAKFLDLQRRASERLEVADYRIPWQNLAKSELEAYVAGDPSARSILLHSIFFEGDIDEVLDRAYMASNRAVPGGVYDVETLIAGVGSGAIRVRHLSHGESTF